ncbi:MAG: S8 family serine peptidase [Halobacteriovoraceae bacterium]|jgi:thermitase|nr:S8 family serine peptidase [Halobacteriovoraceae bacterium]MBT5095986.1 S8 family serine peptidase [Halobacteriovoraceae bacterium]
MKRMTLLLLVLAFSTFANAKEGIRFHPNRLIVKMNKGQQVPHSKYITGVKNLFGTHYVVQTSAVEELQNELSGNSNVTYTEKDYYAGKRDLGYLVPTPLPHSFKSAPSFNDPKLSRQWLFKDAVKHGISVSKAYSENISTPQKEIIVAVVDTGVDYNHEDLKEVMWVNAGEIPGNGIDDDANGYIDDIHGINTLVRDSNGNATVNMMDGHSHGSHVSGIIGAKQNNGKGIAGIASNVRIMGIRTVPNSADELDVDVAEAFIYAAKNGAKIINCSFGKAHNEGGQMVAEAIKHIGEEYGVLVVAASGNSSADIDRRLTYPASFPNEHLMVVASTTSGGRMSYFSNYGARNVDLAAPGSSIYSTVPGNRYSSMSGTSMASPASAGVAAEVLSNFPNLTPLQLKAVLMDSTTPIGRFSGRMVSGGRIDLVRALQKASEL